MLKRVITFVVALFTVMYAVGSVENEPIQCEVPKKENIKRRWIGLKMYRMYQKIIKTLKGGIVKRIRRILMMPYVMMLLSIDAMSRDASAWAKDVTGMDLMNRPCGCWHTTDDGATKEAYAGAVYKETWPASADGAYSDGDTISGDMNWDVSCESGVEHVWVGVGGCSLARCKMDNDGSGTATVVTAPIAVTQSEGTGMPSSSSGRMTIR